VSCAERAVPASIRQIERQPVTVDHTLGSHRSDRVAQLDPASAPLDADASSWFKPPKRKGASATVTR
jgi:hypothetical protein